MNRFKYGLLFGLLIWAILMATDNNQTEVWELVVGGVLAMILSGCMAVILIPKKQTTF